MSKAGRILGIPVLDHVIYDRSGVSYYSYRKTGRSLDGSIVGEVHSRHEYC